MTSFDLSRRGLILGAAGGAALLAAGRPQPLQAAAHATAPLPTFYDRMVGNLRLTTLLDGYFELDKTLVTNLGGEQITEGMRAAYLDPAKPIPLAISTHVIRQGDEITLVDAGAGGAFGPTAGRMRTSLELLGVAPEEVTRIVLTHMHPDHIGGLIGENGPVFPNASLHVSEADHAFWTDEMIASGAPESSQGFFALARAVSEAYTGRTEMFGDNTDLGGGLTTLAMPGHTPGHSGVRVSDGSDQLIIWGDSTALASLQFSHPDAGIAFDADGVQAAETRRRVLDMVVADKIAVAGTHLPFPGIGHVEEKDGAYAWVPEEWQHI
jgi:glyoxylase-like metal-dependent hydrolase (beta-lactamase superfamily II)